VYLYKQISFYFVKACNLHETLHVKFIIKVMKFKYLQGILILMMMVSIHAQRSFQTLSGKLKDDEGVSVIQLPDSGYLVGGYTQSALNSITYSTLSRTNKFGKYSPINSIFSTPVSNISLLTVRNIDFNNVSGNYVILNNSLNALLAFSKGYLDIAISEMDKNLNLISTHNISGNRLENALSMAVLKDGNYAVCGTLLDSTAIPLPRQDAFIFVYNSQLKSVKWGKRFLIGYDATATKVIQDKNGELVVIGSCRNKLKPLKGHDIFVYKFDSETGNIKDYIILSDNNIAAIVENEAAMDVLQLEDEEYLLLYTLRVNTVNSDIGIVKLNKDLKGQKFSYSLSSPNETEAVSLVRNKEGMIAIGGQLKTNTSGLEAFIYKFRINGANTITPFFQKSYGSSGDEVMRQMIPANHDSGFVFTGYTNSTVNFSSDAKNIYLVKADVAGEAGCYSNNANLVLANHTINFDAAKYDTVQNMVLTVSSLNFVPQTEDIKDSVLCTLIPLRIDAGKDTFICTGNTIKIGDTIIGGTAPYTIQWTPSYNISDVAILHPEVKPDIDTIYILTVTDAKGLKKSDTIRIRVAPSVTTFKGLKASYCTSSFLSKLIPDVKGGRFIGSGVVKADTLWYFNPELAGPGTHTIRYVGCPGNETAVVTLVQPAPCVSTVVNDETSSAVQDPQGIFTDCKGQIFTTNKNSILKVDTFGNAFILVGDTLIASHIDGHVSVARLNSPYGLVVDPGGIIYWADGGSQTIRMLRNDTVITIAGKPNVVGDVSNVAGVNAEFQNPFGIALDPGLQFLYISESKSSSTENKVKSIDLRPGQNYFVRTLCGGGSIAIDDINNKVKSNQAEFRKLGHLAVDNQNIFISDQETHMVYRFHFGSDTVFRYAGQYGSPGNATGSIVTAQLNTPIGMSITCQGDVYVADKNNNAIKRISRNQVTRFAGQNNAICGDVDGSALTAKLCHPTAISVFVKGYIDIADTDNDKIKRLSISDWKVGPWVGMDTSDYTYCLGEAADTLRPLYPCGFYKGPGISQLPDNRFIFTPPAVIGQYKLTYVFKIGYCEDSISAIFRVVDNPTVDLLDSTAICAPNPALLDVGAGYKSYLWSTSQTTQSISVNATGKYWVRITDFNNCPSSDTSFVISRTPPVVDAGNPLTICAGNPVNLGGSPTATGNAPFQYRWHPVTGIIPADTIDSNPIAYPLINTKFFVNVQDRFGCRNRDSVQITVNLGPVVNAGIDADVCQGQSIQIGGSPSVSGASGSAVISWAPAALLNDFTLANPSVLNSINVNTDFVLTVNDGPNCIKKDTVVVTVRPLPVVDAGNDDSICSGQSFPINVNLITLAPSYTVSWAPIVGLIPDNALNVIASPAATTNYVATVTDSYNCKASDDITIVVNSLNVDAGNNRTVCEGEQVQLGGSPTASGVTGAINYLWTGGLSGSNPQIIASATQKYFVTINTGNCSKMDSILITVNPKPIASISISNTSICEGDSVLPIVTGGTSVTWTPLAGVSNTGSYTPVLKPLLNTNYNAIVSNVQGCKDTVSLNVTVHSLPRPLSLKDTILCSGDSAFLIASAGGNNSYRWQPAGLVSDSLASSVWVKPMSDQLFSVNIKSIQNCNFDTSISVSVKTKPNASVNIKKDTTICRGNSIQFIASGGNNYNWLPVAGLSNAGIFNPLASPNDSTIYTVRVSLLNGCYKDTLIRVYVNSVDISVTNDTAICNGNSISLIAAGASSYLWTPVSGLSNDKISNPIASPLTTSTYFVTSTDAKGCSAKDSILITVYPLPIADAGISRQVCSGDSIILGGANVASGGTAPYHIKWTSTYLLSNDTVLRPIVNPINPHTFYLEVTDIRLCKGIDSVSFGINPLPLSNAGLDDTICYGFSKQIGGNPAGSGTIGPYTYKWFPNLALDSDIADRPVSSALASTWYKLRVSDGNNCKSLDSMLLTVLPQPGIDLSDTSICYGDTVPLTARGGTDYTWIPAYNISNAGISNPLVWPWQTTQYDVVISSKFCGPNVASINIIVNPRPVALAAPDTLIFRGSTIQLIASGGENYLWTPITGLLDAEDIANPQATPLVNTDYIVRVGNNFNCYDYDTASIQLNFKFDFFVPSAFTPNGDGENDVLAVKEVGVATLHLRIYNRWGDLVFESSDKSIGWDGYYKGELLNMQTFGYILELVDYDGIKYTRKGNVTLIR